jgi:hypothetical protein
MLIAYRGAVFMKKIILPAVLMCMITVAVPAHAFLDYLFGGSQSRDAIDNSAVGDLRAWWSGNPAYQFNPYYSPQQQNPTQGQAAQGGQQMGAPQVQPPTVNYYPQQGGQQPYYGQPSAGPQGMGQQYQGAPQGYQQMPAQHYQAMPQQYQPAPQSYMPPGQPPAQYPSQAYQQPLPQQQYQAAPQGYPAGAQQYPASPSY